MTIGLSDYEFQLNDTGEVLNGPDIATPFVDIVKVTGLDSAPYRETLRDHEGQDGGFIDAEFETGRDVILEGTAFCDITSVEPYLDNLKANFAPVTEPIPLYFKSSGVAERVIFVKPRGVKFEWETARRIGMTAIQFLMYAEDPRIYDNNLQSSVITFGGLATTGFGFPFGFNLSFGATVPPNGTFIVVLGNRPTPGILTISGPVTDPVIINDTDSKTLAISITLGVGDTLVLDMQNRTAILNGVTNVRGSMTQADWFLFNPGSTFIRFGGASGTAVLTITDDFEDGDLSDWTSTGATAAITTTQTHGGTYAGLLTVVGSPTLAFSRLTAPVNVGQSCSLSLWVRSTPGYSSVGCAIDWYDAANVFLSSSTFAGTVLAAATWEQRSVTASAPANAAFAKFGPTLSATPTGQTLFWDDVVFIGAASPTGTLTVSYRNAWR